MITELELIAQRLAELGHPTRLTIFKYLVKAGNEGAPVGEIQEAIGIPGSTRSHHLSRLVSAGLVVQERDARTLFCKPVFPAITETLDYLLRECCQGSCTKK